MGFYGQVVYEFTKMFSKFMITKKSDDEEPITPPEINNDIFLEASNMWEQINIKPTNRWIQLDGNTEADTTKTIKIGHGTPGESDDTKTTVSFSQVTDNVPNEGQYIQLKNGDYLKTAISKYDQAGHFINNENPSYVYYKLPTAQLTILSPDKDDDEDTDGNITPSDSDVLQVKGDGQWISLVNNGNALKIAHIIEPDTDNKTDTNSFECLSPYDSLTKEQFLSAMADEGKNSIEIDTMTEKLNAIPGDMTIIPLESGDLIQSQQISQDTNGHILTMSPVYYKLPVQPTTVSFEQHDSRITNLETRLNNNSSTPSTIRPIGETESVEYGTYETDIVQRVYNAGNMSDMYTNPNSNAMTVTKTIGKIDDEKESVLAALKALLGNQARSRYTISEAIQALAAKISEQQNQINVLMKAVGGNSNE